MKVLHVLLSVETGYGGPPIVVRNLIRAMTSYGVESSVITLGRFNPFAARFANNVQVRVFSTLLESKLGLPKMSSFLEAMLTETKDADIIHLHDLWHIPQLVGAVASQLHMRPYVASPHGALEPWCLTQHRVLKTIAWRTYQRPILNGAARVHALTEEESKTIRRLKVKSPTTVIPTGLDLPEIDGLQSSQESMDGGTIGEFSPFVLYLGRLDPKKQLDVLVDSFALLATANPDVSMVIAGPDSLGMWNHLENQINQYGLARRVRYLGQVDERTKFSLLRNAELLVQPSLTEGLSVTVLEALACSTPVIVSLGCNIPEVAESRAGFVVDASPPELAETMAMVLDDTALHRMMRQNARRLVETKFTAPAMAEAMKRVYEESLLHRAES